VCVCVCVCVCVYTVCVCGNNKGRLETRTVVFNLSLHKSNLHACLAFIC